MFTEQRINNQVTKSILGVMKLIFPVCFSAITYLSYSQAFDSRAFKMLKSEDQSIILNTNIDESVLLSPFIDLQNISGLAISGNINLNSDSSLIRIILIDNQYNEYLIYEAYPLLIEESFFSIDQIGEETAVLNNIIPVSLKIDVVDASIYISKISLVKNTEVKAKAKKDIIDQQQLIKINRINANIKKKGYKWIAGETSVSKLTYEEKKQLFGGKIPNLQGFEYYVGGIFVIPGALKEKATSENIQLAQTDTESLYVDEYSWRNRHGQDWMTSVKDQGKCGSCWAFGSTGSTELLVNLYFNRHIDVDLSEQELISCSNFTGNCSGGAPHQALDYIHEYGLVYEACFPYMASNIACNLCPGSEDRIRIGERGKTINTNAFDSLKKSIIKGPVVYSIMAWGHTVTLVGYKTLRAGDRILIKTFEQSNWITIPAGDPLIGRTAWLIKNSWGSYFGENGYAFVVTEEWPLSWTLEVSNFLSSMIYNDSDILCVDNDRDGYYSWGIGPKPAHCPPCPEEPDGDDSDPCAGPMDEYGNLLYFASPPDTKHTIVSTRDSVPDLYAEGENIAWYGDERQTDLLQMGNSFHTGIFNPGIYTYYVTQTLSGCESQAIEVFLTITGKPDPPVASNVTICDGETVTVLSATGENIKWYADPELTVIVHSGSSYPTGQTKVGIYTYYATQTVLNSESLADTVTLTINPVPEVPLTENIEVCKGTPIPDLTASGNDIRWYADPELTILLHEGNTFATSKTRLYYVTQTLSGCESQAIEVFLSIFGKPEPPVASNITICEGESIPDLSAIGENIQWYTDTALTDMIYSGSSYSTGKTRVGVYTYYITQTVRSCESKAKSVILQIHPLPSIDLGNDTTIYTYQNINLGFANTEYIYLWSNGSVAPSIEITGQEIGVGEHPYWLNVIDKNSCTYSDSIMISVLNPTYIDHHETQNQFEIFPVPTRDIVYVKVNSLDIEDLMIKIINPLGTEFFVKNYHSVSNNITFELDISDLSKGYYIIFITGRKFSYSQGLIVN